MLVNPQKKTLNEINLAVKEAVEEVLGKLEDQELKDQLALIFAHHQETGGEWLLLTMALCGMKYRADMENAIMIRAQWARICNKLTEGVTWQ